MSAVTILHWMHPKRTQLLRANLESSISTMRSVRSVDTLFITNFRKFQFHSLGRHICTVPDRTPCLRRDSSASLREGAPQLMDYKQTISALRSAYSIPSTAYSEHVAKTDLWGRTKQNLIALHEIIGAGCSSTGYRPI